MLVSKIRSILIRIGFVNLFSILPSEIISKHIIPFLSTSQDKFTHRHLTGNNYKAFGCTSKKNKEWVEKTNAEWEIQHVALKAQQEDVKSKGFKSCKEAIAYTMKQGYSVLDLRDFKDVTDEILEDLFKDYPHLQHFMVNSDKITKLPACSQLQTLDCSFCILLKALPEGMVNLEQLNCSYSSFLTALPEGMVKLAVLDCSYNFALKALPEGMVKLAALNCSGCRSLTALPADVVKLAYLNCAGCRALKSLPEDMVNLATLECHDCPGLTALPVNMVKLARLDCSNCPGLTALPAGMVKLEELDCHDCPALTALPSDLPVECCIWR